MLIGTSRVNQHYLFAINNGQVSITMNRQQVLEVRDELTWTTSSLTVFCLSRDEPVDIMFIRTAAQFSFNLIVHFTS